VVRVLFDRKFRLEFYGARITGDAGLFAVRELDVACRLAETAAVTLAEPRAGRSTKAQGPNRCLIKRPECLLDE